MRFLEREVQMAALLGYAAESADGNGRLVLLEGEPGVGKSTLFERLSERLPDALWCWGHCDGVATPTALAPLHDIAATLGGPLAEACRTSADRDNLFTLLLQALRDSPAPVVLAVEDVHWADEATLDLLRYLGRRLRGTRALVLVSYRDEALAGSDPLRVAIGDLATQRSTRRVGLPPLTFEAVELLVDGTGLDPLEVHRLTGGNPFFLAELLKTPGDHLPLADVAKAHMADLQTQSRYDVDYLRYWVDEAHGKIFCLVEAPSSDAAATVHREAHGLVAAEIYQVQEGS